MLLWLVKHSRTDIANSVHELLKVLDSASNVSYKEMLRSIKFILDTKLYRICMCPTYSRDLSWELLFFTDSDYAGDPDSRRSVSGYIIFIRGVPVAWKSKAQRSVTLSSSKAEWIVLSEAVKDIIFIFSR